MVTIIIKQKCIGPYVDIVTIVFKQKNT